MNKIKSILKELKDYRHWIMIAAVVASIVVIPFFFQYAHLRIAESFVDLGNSFKFYFSELFDLNLQGENSVNEFTAQPFRLPFNLPRTWEEFAANMSGFFTAFFSSENFGAYMAKVADVLFYISKILLVLLPVVLLLVVVALVVPKVRNNDFGKETKALRRFKKFELKVCKPVKEWFIEFIQFVREHGYYITLLVFIWAYSFNFIAIFVELFAYLFYFFPGHQGYTIYVQACKLLMDLSVMIDFIPVPGWIVISIVLLNVVSRKMAMDRLRHYERRNRGFINKLGVSNAITGAMGVGKTLPMTSIAISAECKIKDDCLDILLECDFEFPFFPWSRYEHFLKRMYERHIMYDKYSIESEIYKRRDKWLKRPHMGFIFGYDYKRYGLTYDDGLKLEYIWDVLKDYALAYYVYTRQCSYIFSNYAVRSDIQCIDNGNFPVFDCDFFTRESKLVHENSRYSHIIDYDVLRLGKVMNEENPNRYAFGFGVYLMDEFDKEVKNKFTLKEQGVKGDDDDCNQLNDGTATNIMTARHAFTIRNRCLLVVLYTTQRIGAVGSSFSQLGDGLNTIEKGDMSPCLPFFSPYWLFELIGGIIIDRYDSKYVDTKNLRADISLPMYLSKGIVAKMKHYRQRAYNQFGVAVRKFKMKNLNDEESESVQKKYYDLAKKDFYRYKTDCLSGMYVARSALNKVGIDDFEEYDGIMATDEELLKQNSHFQKEVHNFGKDKPEKDSSAAKEKNCRKYYAWRKKK